MTAERQTDVPGFLAERQRGGRRQDLGTRFTCSCARSTCARATTGCAASGSFVSVWVGVLPGSGSRAVCEYVFYVGTFVYGFVYRCTDTKHVRVWARDAGASGFLVGCLVGRCRSS